MARDAAGNWIGYGPGDSSPEVAKIEHRLLAAYPTNSHAQALGVKEDQLYTDETAAAVKELAKFVNNDPTLLERMAGGKRLARAEDLGVADLAFRKAIGAYIPPDAGIPPGHRSKYPIQGVWADSRAFFNPPEAHSFLKATDQFRDEFMRLYRPMAGTPHLAHRLLNGRHVGLQVPDRVAAGVATVRRGRQHHGGSVHAARGQPSRQRTRRGHHQAVPPGMGARPVLVLQHRRRLVSALR